MNTHERLPSYKQPPVIEVAMSVQFEQMRGFDALHVGLLWDRLRHRYPKSETKPPIDSQIERLGVFKAQKVRLEILQDVPMPRYWFLTESGNDILQVQADRFIRNWRRTSQPAEAYPRYEDHVRPRFIEDYRAFEGFLADQGLAESYSPNQCEITYINDIWPNETWSTASDIAKVFAMFNDKCLSTAADQAEPWEVSKVHFLRILKDEEGEFVGRLHLEIKSLLKLKDESEAVTPFLRLTMTARGRPMGDGSDGIMKFMDFGRSVIVRNFDEVTTSAMHAEWGRQE